jgi:hypothetical protein
VPLHVPVHPEAERYLETKRLRMGHTLPDNSPTLSPSSPSPSSPTSTLENS